MNKRSLIALSLLLGPAISINALTAKGFSSDFGLYGIASSDSTQDTFSPVGGLISYFDGQLNITNNLMVRGDFQFLTDGDIIKKDAFSETDSKFKINGASATFLFKSVGASHFVSAYGGIFEPVGTDSFLQRQFGITGVHSLLTESRMGENGPSAYSIDGKGGSYLVNYNKIPLAAGLYVYKTDKEIEEEVTTTNATGTTTVKETHDRDLMNVDIRLATAFRYLTIDILGGGAAIINTEDSNGDKVFLLVDTLYLHCGAEILLGPRRGPSLFIQTGFDNWKVKKGDGHDFDKDYLYALIEPRLFYNDVMLTGSLFFFPDDTAKKLAFVDNQLGVNGSLSTKRLPFINKDIECGLHVTSSISKKNLYDLKDLKDFKKDFELQVTPFCNFGLFDGTAKTMFSINMTKAKRDSFKHAFKLTLGYTTRL